MSGSEAVDETFEERMSRLTIATDGIRAPSGLEARVLGAIAARGAELSRAGRWAIAWRPARRGAVMALIAAVLSVAFAFWDDHRFASEVARSGEDRMGIGGDP